MQLKVRDGMTPIVVQVGPAHTLRQAARMMSAQRVGAAVVHDSDRSGIGILTERDILNSMGADQDPDAELVSEHRTPDVIFATPEWTLEQAARTMLNGGFRHQIVIDDGEVVGVLSMRDIVRCWSAGETQAEVRVGMESARTGSRAG